MHATYRALFVAIASLLPIASCSSSDASGGGGGSGGTPGGGDSSTATTGTGGSMGNNNECNFSSCPATTNPLTDDACNLLLNGPCGAQAKAAFKCDHDNDR